MAKVTPQDLEDEIVFETSFTADEGIVGNMALRPVAAKQPTKPEYPEALEHVTFVMLVLRNGTKIVGVNYGPVDPADYDSVLGHKLAREDALRQIWPFLGWRMRDGELHQPEPIELNRDAGTGRFVSDQHAAENPDTTVRERR